MSPKSLRFVVPSLLTLAWSGSALAQAQGGTSFPWGLAILLAVVVAVVASIMRSRAARREAQASEQANAYGAPPAAADWGRQPGYGSQPGYGAAPAQPGMGGQVMGGLATGLAVGAGAMVAQEIGRRMMSDHGQPSAGSGVHASPQTDSELARDAGLDAIGGAPGRSALAEDLGIAGGGPWDDAGSDMGGDDGGSWDT